MKTKVARIILTSNLVKAFWGVPVFGASLVQVILKLKMIMCKRLH